MVKVIKVIALDILEALTIAATFIGIASLLVVCVAVGTVCAYSILLDRANGFHFFSEIINLKNMGLIDPVRIPLAYFNWFVLFAAPAWLLSLAVKGYIKSVASRSKSLDITPSNSDDTLAEEDTKQAANA